MSNSQGDMMVENAIALAKALQERACELQTPQEKRQQVELDRMLQHPKDKIVLLQMTDQAFRSNTAWRAAEQLTHILDAQGVPRFFSPIDRALLRGFQSFGGYLPGVAVPLVKEKMQQETANVVLPANTEQLSAHLVARTKEGLRMNVNFLGEALLGEADAEKRIKHYLQTMQIPAVEVVSVKISTIYSQISPLGRAHTVSELCDKMELLYRAAAKARFTRPDGTKVPKFIYLDMEEYRDMSITAEVFMRTLDDPDLRGVGAGIALQGYIPDSFKTQKRLTEWAQERTKNGGAPITIRIVKGANLEMEKVEASHMGWTQAPFDNKTDTDANFKRMLIYAFEPDRIKSVRVGVASHNLFDIAFALNLAEQKGVGDHVQFEMLEGMANHQRRALFEKKSDLLLYAPACKREDFVNAIGYLVRRLDENTGPDNFLRHAFRLHPGSPEWQRLEDAFRESFKRIDALSEEPRRQQDRRKPAPRPPSLPHFVNEPDTDWSLPHHGQWAQSIYESHRAKTDNASPFAPLVIAGHEIRDGRRIDQNTDPSRPGTVVSRYCVATRQDVDDAITCAKQDPDEWRQKDAKHRAAVLREVAHLLRQKRAAFLGIALCEAGKVLSESDPEFSEAIDFCEYYARSAEELAQFDNLKVSGRGVVVVIPPWNFPIAIPCGGVAAALAAGNTVIFKPAPSTVAIAYMVAECFWEAGVSRNTLQFVFADNKGEGTHLATHPDIDAVVFTGGTATANFLLRQRPQMRLLAETGGKNAIIVSAMSDRDLAIKGIVHSAFGHAGQKCSACSLLILEDEVYDDPAFKESLIDATKSLHVGSAWQAETKVGPLIRPPGPALENALKELEDGESWALMPHRLQSNPHLWSPAIKWGVSEGSVTHLTEFFGPVLGVMRAKNLEEAIRLANGTGYGLTSGLYSLDDREQTIWKKAISAGNLYINRTITGAIVSRQPFGGMGKSAFGPGIKAGGPNYLVALSKIEEFKDPETADEIDNGKVADLLTSKALAQLVGPDILRRLDVMARSCTLQMRQEFSLEHDLHKLLGQDNIRRYLPVPTIGVRICKEDTPFEILARICAAKIAGCRIRLSYPNACHEVLVNALWDLTEDWAGRIEFLEENDAALAKRMLQGQSDRLRFSSADQISKVLWEAAAESGTYMACDAVRCEGRIEMLWYLQEQSISFDYHRYGNIGARAFADDELTK